MNKKGLQFSIGLIVVLILSILIFGLALSFVFKWFGQAEQLKAEIDKQTQEQIMQALQTGNTLVAIPLAVQQVKKGAAANFGVGVRNIVADKTYSIAISYSGAYTPDGRRIPVNQEHMARNWLGAFSTTEFNLKKNENKVVPLLIKVDASTGAGTTSIGDYVFNVCVYDAPLINGMPPTECSATAYSNNPTAFYTGKMYQVTLRVQ